jgi:shikimate kinase
VTAAAPTRHLVLVGLMGAGKTSVGAECAARLGRPFVDTDHAVEAEAHRTVREIFEADGEAAFRSLERAAVRRAALDPTPAVIACGGGAAVDPDNRAVLREHGHVVWLDAPVAALADRATRTPGARPLLAVGDPIATLEGLAAARHDAYADIAHVRVDTAGRTVTEVADLVLEEFGA